MAPICATTSVLKAFQVRVSQTVNNLDLSNKRGRKILVCSQGQVAWCGPSGEQGGRTGYINTVVPQDPQRTPPLQSYNTHAKTQRC